MNETVVSAALDELVPEPSNAFGDWQDVLRRAGIRTPVGGVTVPTARRRRPGPRSAFALAVLVVLAVVLFTTPAFGILRDLIGRTDLPFTGKQAPYEVRRDFYDMSIAAPPGMDPQAIAAQTRRVAAFYVHGKTHVLYVAPTRKGGFCDSFSGSFGGCRPSRSLPHGAVQPGEVHPFLLGTMGSLNQRRGGPVHVVDVGGDVLARGTQHLYVEYENRSRSEIPFVWVSAPIDAGFYLYGIPAGHTTPGTRVHAIVARDAAGRLLARSLIEYPTRLPHVLPRPSTPQSDRRSTLPPPAAPLQQGSVDGVSITAGANGVAAFDLVRADARVKKLLAAPGRSLACFKFIRYHEHAPFEMGASGLGIAQDNRISLNGLRPPYDGCEVEGGYGHTWPDRNQSHSAVEIAFTPRARRFFADRAAARALALYVRTRRHHGLAGIRSVGSAGAPLPPDTIGYVRTGAETTYVERSTSGRRFTIVVRANKVVRENVKPLAFVF